jgi:valyl-tRNA synthetase
MRARFPEASDFIRDEQSLADMKLLMGIITGIRNIRGEMNIPPSRQVNVVMDIPDNDRAAVLQENAHQIRALAKVEELDIRSGVEKPAASATAVFEDIQVHVLLKGLIDFDEETTRLKKSIAKLEKEMQGANKKLQNRNFTDKAPADVVQKVRDRVEGLTAKLEKLKANLRFFESIES